MVSYPLEIENGVARGNPSGGGANTPTLSVASVGATTGGFSGSTYTTPANCIMIKVRMSGGGGGGGSSGTAAGSGATAGGDTVFGAATAGGGQPGSWAQNIGADGGTVVVGYPGVAFVGGQGAPGAYDNTSLGPYGTGGSGGTNTLGGGCAGSINQDVSVGQGPAHNTGAGGGGAGTTNIHTGEYSGGGGSAGGYIESIITSPAPSYSFSVGAGGVGDSAGTNGFAGVAGAGGIIIVEEYYSNGAVGSATSISMRYTGTSSSVGVIGSPALVTFSTLDYDTDSAYSSGLFTVPPGKAGKYQINSQVLTGATYTINNQTNFYIYKNGSQIDLSAEFAFTGQSSICSVINDVINLADGDTISIYTATNGTAPSFNTTACWLSIIRISS